MNGIVWIALVACLLCASCQSTTGQTATTRPSDRASRLRENVTHLSVTIGERNLSRPDALEKAAAWIERRLATAGGAVVRERYVVAGQDVRNLYIDVRGKAKPEEIVVVGAHYDSVVGSPGANDNGSGVAALLELADVLAKTPLDRTVRFAAFVNEEPPYFQTASMGSLVHANNAKNRGEQIIGMISIETIGCFSDEPGSQKYPPGIPLVLPTVGNYIGVVTDLERKAFGERVTQLMKAANVVPVEGASLPGPLPGVGWSDHWAFWQAGYPAAMVTDTAPFRYAHYHKDSDLPEQLDYARMARVVDALESTVRALASDARP